MTDKTAPVYVFAVLAVVFFAAAGDVSGQTSTTDGAFVSGRVGANIASEPTLGGGASFGAGGSYGFFFRPSWAVEFEVWIPQYVDATYGSYRSVLFGVNARRQFGRKRARAYLLVGGAISKDDNHTPAGHGGGGNVSAQAGGGLHIAWGGRLAVEPEVRVNYMPMMGILRPAVAFVWSLP